MAHAVAEERPPLHMGLPLTNGKVAMWLFLVTEIMFFTGLIGTYIVLRNGSHAWPNPRQVHLVEALGAINTFVLIISSLTIVLAHTALEKKDVQKAIGYIAATLALGIVFLLIKAKEYNDKFAHHVLPGQIEFDQYQGKQGEAYLRHLVGELQTVIKEPHGLSGEAVKKCAALLIETKEVQKKLNGSYGLEIENGVKGVTIGVKDISVKVEKLVHDHPDLHLTYVIPFGNIWVSCYFVMTGFHAIHVLGGLVVFVLMLLLHAMGQFGAAQVVFVELTGLYWHFVDIVWIFLFPLLYLV